MYTCDNIILCVHYYELLQEWKQLFNFSKASGEQVARPELRNAFDARSPRSG